MEGARRDGSRFYPRWTKREPLAAGASEGVRRYDASPPRASRNGDIRHFSPASRPTGVPRVPQPMPPVMLLCGGQGTRLRDVTEILPKPMVPVGSRPIVWHLMKTYASFGVRRFILCLGYKRETFIDYFMNYRAHQTDVTLRLGAGGGVIFHGDHAEEDWEVTLADTGDATMTGGRVARAAKYLRDDEPEFFLTYGDGLADVDMSAVLEHHRRHARSLTLTAVMPDSRFGVLQFDEDRVTHFREKPRDAGTWINAGFMVATRKFVSEYLTPGEGCILEQEPMRRAADDGEISAFRHDGYWQCMDTARDHALLNAQWDSGRAPWTAHWR